MNHARDPAEIIPTIDPDKTGSGKDRGNFLRFPVSDFQEQMTARPKQGEGFRRDAAIEIQAIHPAVQGQDGLPENFRLQGGALRRRNIRWIGDDTVEGSGRKALRQIPAVQGDRNRQALRVEG